MTQRMVPASGPMLLLGFGVSRGLSLDKLCGLIDYAPHQLSDPSRMVPFETSLNLWHALIQSLPDENIGVGLGTFVRLEHGGMYWEFLKYLDNPRAVLRALTRFAPFGDSSCVDDPVVLLELEDRIELRYPKALKYDIPERVETLNVAILGVLSRVAGKPIPARVIRAAHKESPKRRLAEQAYGCTVLYECADDALCFDRAVALTPFPNASPEAAEGLIEMLERKLLPDARLPFIARLRRVLSVQAEKGDTSQRSVARALGLSVRSLQRELQNGGLRYSDELGAALKQVATALMRDRARTLEDIAVELGYSETSSFARSWKRLTGESPARYRARVLSQSV